jgi:hypothetical protein
MDTRKLVTNYLGLPALLVQKIVCSVTFLSACLLLLVQKRVCVTDNVDRLSVTTTSTKNSLLSSMIISMSVLFTHPPTFVCYCC